jgi:segregation and condensation protein B
MAVSSPESPRRALEALIFASGAPATAAQIRRALPQLAPARIPDLVAEINEELASSGRPYEIAEVAGGYQFRTRPEHAETIAAAQPERKLRLSRPALETLAVIAYRQPLTRGDVEDVRGVDCGAVLRSLLERGLVRIVGRRDAPGRPPLYGTGGGFLETFGLRSLRDLPTLRELESLEAEGTGAAEARGGGDEAVETAPAVNGAVAAEAEGGPPDEAL